MSEFENDLGKLYLFPVEELELKAQGIEKQWFLTHQKGDRIFCGHINKNNQWSLCKTKDLSPTSNYYSPDELWQLLEKDEFVAEFDYESEAQKTNILDSNVIKLTSIVDKHTVLAIDKNGEIKDHLSLTDADLLIDDFSSEKEQNQHLDSLKQKNPEKHSLGLEIE